MSEVVKEEVIVEEEVAEETAPTVAKALLDKANKEAADYKKKWKASLDEAGKAKLEQEEKDNRIKELEGNLAKEKISKGLLGKGFTESEVSAITEKAVSGDYDGLVEELGKARTSAISSINKELDKLKLESTKRPADGANGDTTIKKDISKMSLDELQALENESPEELQNI